MTPIKLHWVGCLRVGAGPPKAVVCVCVCVHMRAERGGHDSLEGRWR